MGDSSPITTLCLRRKVVPVQIGLLSCSGLLIHPALFVLTPFHLYRTTYEALSCTELPHLQTSAPSAVRETAYIRKTVRIGISHEVGRLLRFFEVGSPFVSAPSTA